MENIFDDEYISTATEFVNVLKNNPDSAFDFIVDNGYKMSKSELVRISMELLYAIHDKAKFDEAEILASAAEELTEWF